ncbi:MAG TPA: PA2779 family protein [Terriglobia bacterium]|nr:PA2779 family protein [Terriglobia bacterium]
MSGSYKKLAFALFALILAFALFPPQLSAEDHVIPQTSLHQALVNASAARQKQIAQVKNFFASKPVASALKKGGVDLRQVQQAVPNLSDQELAQLATRTQKIQNDFAAGALSNERLTYIVIAIATALIVILILKA